MSAPGATTPFDASTVALAGASSIAASAGTGKTHAITQLYLRLVIEAGIAVDAILVVTYTVAATEELRSRIRDMLGGARSQLDRDRRDDPFLETLLARTTRAEARRRLETALRSFDEASIFTIHGFCQRVLAENAFESAMPFRTDLLPDESELLGEIAEDFWRQRFYDAPPLLAAFLVDERVTPATLLESVGDLVGRPYVAILGPEAAPADLEDEAAFAASWSRARAAWLAGAREVRAILRSSPALNRRSYAATSVEKWLEDVDCAFESETPRLPLPERIDKLCRAEIAKGTRNGHVAPAHAFFDACTELCALGARLEDGYRALLERARVDLLGYARDELVRRKRRLRVQSYDDLLANLAGALDADAGGRLARAVRERWRAALIDEFQDTDPVQYRIFDAIYGGSDRPLFLVGDPKQAIYSFRGADIFAYLDAQRRAERRYHLDRNWRSDPRLVRAVNAIFERVRRPFLFEEVPFQAAIAADRPDRPTLAVDGDPPQPFVVRVLPRGAKGLVSKRQARDVAARATAAEIARLLNLARQGRARIGDRALAGGDVAILVRTNREAKMVRRALLDVHVPSVQRGMESVFATREALELERVLVAIASPGDDSHFRAALATEMLGVGGEELQALQEPAGEPEWEERAGRIRGYHQTWRAFGFVRTFRELLGAESIAERLLPLPDGERRLTNLFHLGELLAAAEVRGRLGIESLLRWLADRRQSASEERDERVEEQQLRLESDEDLVQIVTVHKSKGLEYGLVFCPFAWDGRVWVTATESRGKPFLFHDPETYAPTADLGSEQQATLRACAAREEIAEKLRLLYVALTRARHRCVMFWGAIKEAGTSAPAWLLHQGEAHAGLPTPAEVEARFAGLRDDELLADLEGLRAAAPDEIRIETVGDVPAEVYEPAPADPSVLHARMPARAVPEPFRVASFSSLVGAREPSLERADLERIAGEAIDAEGRDHDSRAAIPPAGAADEAPARSIFAFPRGVRAGTCLHEIFEAIDFATVAPPGGAPTPLEAIAAIRPVVSRKLAEHRFDPEWQPAVTETVRRAVALPLDAAGKVRLAGLPGNRVARELEFYYPVEGLEVAELRRSLFAHGIAGGACEREIEALSFPRVEGFMRGFIDLVFEAGGRFYVLDYKSNHLGDRADDYAPDRLAAAIARDGYYLQYAIYTLTLHRMLALRLPDYDPARHLGGAFYVFLRGLDPDRGPGWSVFHDRPSAQLVRALDRSIAGGGSGNTSRARSRRAVRGEP